MYFDDKNDIYDNFDYRIEECYFHGFGGNVSFAGDNYLTIALNNLQSILDTGYILCRHSLHKLSIDTSIDPENYNENNSISVCFNPKNEYLRDKWKAAYDSKNVIRTVDSGYDFFVENGLSFVFDKNVRLNRATFHEKIQDDEIQIKGNIDIKQALGIVVDVIDDKDYAVSEIQKMLAGRNLDIPLFNVGLDDQYVYLKKI